jgi:hypothetical protein
MAQTQADSDDIVLQDVYDELYNNVGNPDVDFQEQVGMIHRWSLEIIPRLMRGKIKGRVHRDVVDSVLGVFQSYIAFVEIWAVLNDELVDMEPLGRASEAWKKLASHMGDVGQVSTRVANRRLTLK